MAAARLAKAVRSILPDWGVVGVWGAVTGIILINKNQFDAVDFGPRQTKEDLEEEVRAIGERQAEVVSSKLERYDKTLDWLEDLIHRQNKVIDELREAVGRQDDPSGGENPPSCSSGGENPFKSV